MMSKRVIVLLGIFLGSLVPAAAQTPAPPIVLARERLAPTVTMLQTVSPPLPADSFLLSRDLGKSAANFSRLFAGAYEPDDSLERLLPMETVKTVLFTQASLPLVQLWSRRLQLDAFQNTFHMQNAQPYPGGPRSIHLSGLSVSFHFGRDARTRRPIQAWRSLPRIVGAVLN
jgi:hypothetical protein